MVTIYTVCLFFLLLSVNANKYNGYKIYEIFPSTENDVAVVENLQNTGIVELWTELVVVRKETKVMVSPKNLNFFLDEMTKNNMAATVIFEDLQRVIENQNQAKYDNVRKRSNFLSFDWDVYHNLEDIYKWLDEIAETYPEAVKTVVMGTSVEGRDIKGVKIDFKPDRTKKNIGMIEGGIHAREWISPATVTWIIKEFITSTDSRVRRLAEDLQWHIFPSVNPDGYAYTFSTERMWRKNRNRANFTICQDVDDEWSAGVDLNRNFDFFWMSVGASDDPCSRTFAGSSPVSEPETQAISEYVLKLKDQGNIIYYLAFHSFSQLIVVPYSHVDQFSQDVLIANNYGDMYEIAIRGAAKLSERHGTNYRVGVSDTIMYKMSGTSFDWAKHHAGVNVSLLFELRDQGYYSFLLPADQIIPNCEELMDALIEMDQTTRNLGYYYTESSAALKTLSVSLGLLSILFILMAIKNAI